MVLSEESNFDWCILADFAYYCYKISPLKGAWFLERILIVSSRKDHMFWFYVAMVA